MHDEGTPDPGQMFDEIQRLVLCVLLLPAGAGLCSMGELAVAVGDADAAALAVEGLHATGLVHRLGEFVVATRPAVRFHELELAASRLLADEASLQNGRPRHGLRPCRGLHGKKTRFFPCGFRVRRRR